MIKKAKKRIILDYSDDVMADIDALKDNLGVSSRADLVRFALGLLDLATEKTKDGYKMQFRKGDSVVDVALPLLG